MGGRDREWHFLTADARQALREYKYISGGITPLDVFLDRVWWNPVAAKLPTWLAPNLITVIGTVVLMAGTALVVCDCSDFRTPTDRWRYLVAAASMFFYQTADAVDGKQARKTKSSSPLGQLFDHGCDSLAATCGCYCCGVLLLDGIRWATLSLMSMNLVFYLCQWEELWTRKLRTGIGYFGCTEAQWGVAGLCLLGGLFGGEVLNTPLPIPGMQLKHLPEAHFTTSAVIMGLCAITTTVKTAGVRSVVDLLPAAVVVLTATLGVYARCSYPAVRILWLGLLTCYLSCRMILCAVTHMAFPLYEGIVKLQFLPLAVLSAECTSLPAALGIPGGLCDGVLLSVVGYQMTSFLYTAAWEVATFLRIPIFTLPDSK